MAHEQQRFVGEPPRFKLRHSHTYVNTELWCKHNACVSYMYKENLYIMLED